MEATGRFSHRTTVSHQAARESPLQQRSRNRHHSWQTTSCERTIIMNRVAIITATAALVVGASGGVAVARAAGDRTGGGTSTDGWRR